MLRYVGSLLVLLLAFSFSSAADVEIAKKNRIANKPGGFCVWAALETMGRHHKIKSLEGLVERKYAVMGHYEYHYDGTQWHKQWVPFGGSTEDGAYDELKNNHKIGFWLYPRKTYNTKALKEACEAGRAVWVAFEWKNTNIGHAVVLVTYNDEFVEFVDSNKVDKVKKVSRKWFDEHWSGSAIIFNVKAKKKK